MRPEHAALHGVTLPPSSPFWDSFMPPNGWNCRCTAVQVRRGKYPQTDIAEAMERGETATADDKRGMMRFNPGKERSVWPAYNLYTTTRCRDCDIAKDKSSFARLTPPDNVLCSVCHLATTCQMLKSEVIKYGKGEIEINHLVDRKGTDFERVIKVAKFFAAQGEHVTLTPKMDRWPKFLYDCVDGAAISEVWILNSDGTLTLLYKKTDG